MDNTIIPMDEHFDIVIHHPEDGIGAHVAHLHHRGETDNPLAKIHLLPFSSFSSGVEHKVLRPAVESNDGLTSQFDKAVHNWAETTYPMVEDRIYKCLI